jgi:hypothetical protein
LKKDQLRYSKDCILKEDSIHNDVQVVIENEILFKAGYEPDSDSFTHAVQHNWVNKKFGYVEKILVYRRIVKSDIVEIKGTEFNVLSKMEEKNLVLEYDIKYLKSLSVPFPSQIIKWSHRYFFKKNNEPEKFTEGEKYFYDDISINIPDFSVKDFFIYPEKSTKIFLRPKSIELTKNEYMDFFSDLDIDREKMVFRNRFFQDQKGNK